MQKPTFFKKPIYILSHASAVGAEEKRGPLGDCFDFCDPSNRFGAKTWELAESELSKITLSLALKKARLSHEELDLLLAGDLQNQCVASSSAHACFKIPYLGLYGACSTSAEGMYIASSLLAGDHGLHLSAVVTSSHFCAAERQFRLPLEYGGQRTPTAQWTATAAGAFLLTDQKPKKSYSKIVGGMVGIPINGEIKDASNMGAAMAPAAAHSLFYFFKNTKKTPSDFDAIVTGDLGYEGSELMKGILCDNGFPLLKNHLDCGTLLYNPQFQDVHAGGSGCGCSASVLSAHFLPLLETGKLKSILFLATGALMSPSSILQGGSIIGIAPLLVLEGESEEDTTDENPC
jgi:stage V sporulation protein AD